MSKFKVGDRVVFPYKTGEVGGVIAAVGYNVQIPGSTSIEYKFLEEPLLKPAPALPKFGMGDWVYEKGFPGTAEVTGVIKDGSSYTYRVRRNKEATPQAWVHENELGAF